MFLCCFELYKKKIASPLSWYYGLEPDGIEEIKFEVFYRGGGDMDERQPVLKG